LVGETVPAYRPTLQRWHLGQVQSWRNNTDTVSGEACLCFDGNTAMMEWLHLESAPFDAYTCHVRECNENEIRLDNNRHDEDSQNLGDIFRLSSPESPASSFRDGLHTLEKENSTKINGAYTSPLFATTSPSRTPLLLDRNSEDDYQSEEEETTNQKACPRLWTIDVSENGVLAESL
jgi:hypothetical protein